MIVYLCSKQIMQQHGQPTMSCPFEANELQADHP